MQKFGLTAFAIALAAAASACESAVAPDHTAEVGAARFDGGTLGTGHVAPADGGTLGTGHLTVTSDGAGGEIAPDTTGRGGTLGTGH